MRLGLPPKVITEYGQRPPDCVAANPIGPDSTLFIHFSAGDGEGIDKKGEPKQAVRNIQAFHMGPEREWCDTGYSWVLIQPRGIFKRPLLFKGRGFHAVPASQENFNRGNMSICVIADDNDKIKRSTFRALAWATEHCPARTVKGHRDVGSTGCPGDRLYSKVPMLNRVAKRAKKTVLP
jgi:hypothetical protein